MTFVSLGTRSPVKLTKYVRLIWMSANADEIVFCIYLKSCFRK